MSLLLPSLTPAAQNIAPGDPSGRLTRLACSSVDLLWVMSYAPGEGDQGTPISVDFTCKADLALGVHVRLVVGRRAVSTQVREMDPPGSGRWQLKGCAPCFSKQKSPSAMVPLTIQAVDKENQIVDSVTFGDFVYHDADTQLALQPPSPPSSARPLRRPSIHIVSGDPAERCSKRRSPYSQPQTPSSSDSEHGSSTSRPGVHSTIPALRRASRQLGPESDDPTQTVILDITTPLDAFCFGWEESELHAGRRLVRFRRLQDGNKLIVSAERITQAEYNSDDIVISCIYREETDSCCVTSVDIIHLLQRLVEADFEVDEKNRIRRNLEGLRPTTVSKTRPGFESFFQRIMDFPDPKPRKIEKDVKVFDWKLLPHALDKILSKYSLHASSTSSSPKDDIPSPSFSPSFPRELFTETSSVGTPYTDSVPPLPQEPQLDAFYLSHASPVAQLSSFPSECSPDSSPEMHRRPSLQEEHLQPLYLGPDLIRTYYPQADLASTSYGIPQPGSGPLRPSSMYTAESSTAGVLPPDSTISHSNSTSPSDAVSPFISNQIQSQRSTDWTNTMAPCNSGDILLVSPLEPYSPAPTYGYGPPDATSSMNDLYASPSSIPPSLSLLPSLSSYQLHAYDPFEFDTLRDHNAGTVLASQHA